MLLKAGKAIERLNAIQAEHKAIIQRHQAQLEQLQSQKLRKKFPVDPNTRIANIEVIKKTQEEAAALDAAKKTKDCQPEAQNAPESIQKATFESMLFSWQLEL